MEPQPAVRTHDALAEERLAALLAAFAHRRALVIGDCMLDEYLWGAATRISPEAPVMVVEEGHRTYAAGGASNVAANLVALGARTTIVAVVGDDQAGTQLRRVLHEQGVEHEGLVTSPDRPTTLKSRIMAHHQQVLRVDRELRRPLSPEEEPRVLRAIQECLRESDLVVLSDYSKGLLGPSLVTQVIGLARAQSVPVFANAKPASARSYAGAALVSLNQSEAEGVLGRQLPDIGLVAGAVEELVAELGCVAVMMTLGGRGLVLGDAEHGARHFPVMPLDVYDPCGCGDSAIAALSLGRSSGASWDEAAVLANLAGSAKVRKLGVVPVTRDEIRAVWGLRPTDIHPRETPAPRPARHPRTHA